MNCTQRKHYKAVHHPPKADYLCPQYWLRNWFVLRNSISGSLKQASISILLHALFTCISYDPQIPLNFGYVCWKEGFISHNFSHKSQCFKLATPGYFYSNKGGKDSQRVSQQIIKHTSEKELYDLLSGEAFSIDQKRTLEDKIRSRGLEL